jgi:hypothetical protein
MIKMIMKKRGLILVLTLLFVTIFITSFVSAGDRYYYWQDGACNAYACSRIDRTEPFSFGLFNDLNGCPRGYFQGRIGYNGAWEYDEGCHGLSGPCYNNPSYNPVFCYKQDSGNLVNSGAYEFGGMYSNNLNNPTTGSKSCPAGFQKNVELVYGQKITACYKDKEGTGYGKWFFGGMYGSTFRKRADGDNYGYIRYENPASDKANCPAGYNSYCLHGDSSCSVGPMPCKEGTCRNSIFFCMKSNPDQDGDGHIPPNDCDDTNPDIWQIVQGYVDGDGDGDGAGNLVDVCGGNSLDSGYSSNDDDCDDTDKLINLAMPEDCITDYDDNCNGQINEGCTNITGASWRDMNRRIISDNEVDLNDRVILLVGGEYIGTSEINYTIYKSVAWWFDKKMAKNQNMGFTTWKANKSGTYYFKAKIEGIGEQLSGDLVVSENEDNFIPVAEITGPEDRQIYFLGTELSFTQSSYDEDDEFDYTWNLGDGTNKTGNSSTKENWGFDYTYNTPGQKNVLLTVDDGRGGFGRDYISILIVNSSHVLSYIDSPKWQETVGQNIKFNASGSYVVNYDANTEIIDCLAGNCPLTTGNCPINSDCTNNLSVQNASLRDYMDMNFTWVFTNGLTKMITTEKILNNPIIDMTFSVPSTPLNPHIAVLTVNY